MLGAIHFGRTKIQRVIKFSDSCYYNILTEDDLDVHRLIGFSYGYHEHNSVSIGWRPSENRLDHINLFAIVCKGGNKTIDYFHTLPTNKACVIKIKVDKDYSVASFRVFNVESGEGISYFKCSYELPFLKMGYVLNPKIESKVRKNVSVYLNKTDFQYGNN